MAHRQGIAVTNSRFACLKIEDDEDEVKKLSVKQNVQQNPNNTAKKRDKKKNSKDAEEVCVLVLFIRIYQFVLKQAVES